MFGLWSYSLPSLAQSGATIIDFLVFSGLPTNPWSVFDFLWSDLRPNTHSHLGDFFLSKGNVPRSPLAISTFYLPAFRNPEDTKVTPKPVNTFLHCVSNTF
jgi:hypothetical protein